MADDIWLHGFEGNRFIHGVYLTAENFRVLNSGLFSFSVPLISPKGLSHSF